MNRAREAAAGSPAARRIERLDDRRLLDAIVGRSRIGDQIEELLDADGLLAVADRDVVELVELGASPSAAHTIATVFELVRRVSRARRGPRPEMRTPEQVLRAIGAEVAMMRVEELWCLPLDAHARLIGQPRIVTRGDVDGTDAGPRVFFRCALAAGASSCVAVHGHPSGDASPSLADLVVTRRLAAAGRAIDVPLADHVVIGHAGTFCSLRRHDATLFF
ncbi:MAG: hypothetical protein H0X45_00390 [Planctomycetes bacterium]|nr:hypothetical protein [Planctomycetota bacterium]